MIRVPVILDFDYEKVIGFMEVDESQLPKSPDFVFSFGYHLKDINSFEYSLKCISPIPDNKYVSFLEQRIL